MLVTYILISSNPYHFRFLNRFFPASWDSLEMFSNKSRFMNDRIMWTNFKRFNESHFIKLTTKNFMVRKIFIEPKIRHPDDRNSLSLISCIFIAVYIKALKNHDRFNKNSVMNWKANQEKIQECVTSKSEWLTSKCCRRKNGLLHL